MDVVGDVVIPSALRAAERAHGAPCVPPTMRATSASTRPSAKVASRCTAKCASRWAMTCGSMLSVCRGASSAASVRPSAPARRRSAAANSASRLGRYEAYGQELDITRGRLLFDVSPLDDPGLDIEAKRIIDTTTVGLNVRGTLQEPRLTFFSDPSMPQTQIVSYLLTGKCSDAPAERRNGDACSSTQDSACDAGRRPARIADRPSHRSGRGRRRKFGRTAQARRTRRSCSASFSRPASSSATASR